MNVSRVLRNIGKFLFNYRNRIVIASIIAILVAILISYYDTWNPLKLFQHPSNERRRRVNGTEGSQATRERAVVSSGQVPSPGNRSRLLLRIRRQFDISCRHFLPTLRKKIIDTVDLNGTVKQIKELRQTGSPGSVDLERALWEEIKVASFTLMFMSTYTTVALCTVLKLQLHILARSILQTEQVDLRVGSAEDEMSLDNQMFRALIEGTYRQLYGEGLTLLALRIRSIVAEDLSAWTVKEKVQVEYDEFMHMVRVIREHIDEHLEDIIKKLFIPAAEQDESLLENRLLNPAPPSSQQGSNTVQKLLNQTWDILESPAYRVVFKEALDSTMRIVTEHLHSRVYFPAHPHSPSRDSNRTPPLASLLPQVKAVLTELLPEALEGREGAAGALHYKVISSGPLLDSLGVAILNATETHTA